MKNFILRILLVVGISMLIAMPVTAAPKKKLKKSSSPWTTEKQGFAPGYKRGDILVNVNVGYRFTAIDPTVIPPLGGSVEYGISDRWSLGLSTTMTTSFHELKLKSSNLVYSYLYSLAGLKLAYHWSVPVSGLDPYAFLFGGYEFVSYSMSRSQIVPSATYTPDKEKYVHGAALGVAYYLTPNVGLHLEGGYNFYTMKDPTGDKSTGSSLLSGGLSLKF